MRFYEDDKLTGLKIKDSFYEEWKDLINRILFWTIIFAPYMIVLNDIYQNKLMHDNQAKGTIIRNIRDKQKG